MRLSISKNIFTADQFILVNCSFLLKNSTIWFLVSFLLDCSTDCRFINRNTILKRKSHFENQTPIFCLCNQIIFSNAWTHVFLTARSEYDSVDDCFQFCWKREFTAAFMKRGSGWRSALKVIKGNFPVFPLYCFFQFRLFAYSAWLHLSSVIIISSNYCVLCVFRTKDEETSTSGVT